MQLTVPSLPPFCLPPHKQVGRWTEKETETLLELLVEYGEGAWSRMENDPRAREHMPNRSQVGRPARSSGCCCAA